MAKYVPGHWDRDEYDATLFMEDFRGHTWKVRASRDGQWRISPPNSTQMYDDDARSYSEGDLSEADFSNSNERFTATKKAGRAALVELLKALAKE